MTIPDRKKNRAVFLDRDGVINAPVVRDGNPYPPATLAEFQILDGVAEACALLKQLGFFLVVVTNQPDVGRGTQSRDTVEAMHRKMCAALPIDRVEVCYDGGRGAPSEFRKPAPGMLLAAAQELSLDLPGSYMVGDRWRDIDAGVAAGCKTIFVNSGHSEPLKKQPDWRVGNLLEAANIIAMQEKGNVMKNLNDLSVKIFADGADIAGMLSLYANPLIKGLTTNPTLMKKAGIRDYEAFAKDVLATIRTKPISFEVFSDEFPEMRRQALKIRDWQENVYVKIPVTNSRGEPSTQLIRELANEHVKLNVTAILTVGQVREIAAVLNPAVPSVVSVFAGRIADTGLDPVTIMRDSLSLLAGQPLAELLWASVREVLNIFQADECGCHIVTVQHDILAKAIKLCGMDLNALSLDTVKMFKNDAENAGFTLD